MSKSFFLIVEVDKSRFEEHFKKGAVAWDAFFCAIYDAN
jgi:hypothetical protein